MKSLRVKARAAHIILILSLASLCFGFQAAPEGTDIAPIIGLILARALQLTSVVKLGVDALAKGAAGAGGNKLILIACLAGIALDFGILAIQHGTAGFTLQNSVMALIAGTASGFGSKVLTSVHDSTHETA